MSENSTTEQVAVDNINKLIEEGKVRLDDVLDPIEARHQKLIDNPETGMWKKWKARSVMVAIQALRVALDVPDDIGGDED